MRENIFYRNKQPETASRQTARLRLIKPKLLLRVLFLCLVGTNSVFADSRISTSGSLGIELRNFIHSSLYSGQLDDLQLSVDAELSVEWESDSGADQIALVPFYRLDAQDDERTHGDIREAYWRHFSGDWELLAGIYRVFWGVTESRHLVNIINQVDAVENIDEEDYLGQPMLSAGLQKSYGHFNLFVLPYFRERTFAGRDGRLRASLVVDTDHPIYESDKEEQHIDLAFRYSHYIGSWDFGLSVFHGTGREPTLIPNASATRLLPFYNIVTQYGLDLQYTGEGWLWKLESIYRQGQGDAFAAAVGGVEYTFYQSFGTDWDIGLLAEYQYDDRSAAAPSTSFQNDLFVGTRLVFNDVQDSSILGGVIVDNDDNAIGVRLEAQRRIGDSYRLELEAQWFTNTPADSPSAALAADDFIQLSLKKYW